MSDAVSRAEKIMAEAAQRRRAFEAGARQGEARFQTAKKQAERWKEEAAWWKEEHRALHAEFCEFVAYVASELGLNKPKEKP